MLQWLNFLLRLPGYKYSLVAKFRQARQPEVFRSTNISYLFICLILFYTQQCLFP